MAVKPFFAGTLKRIGQIYLQTVLDCQSYHAWARLYTSDRPLAAIQILYNERAVIDGVKKAV